MPIPMDEDDEVVSATRFARDNANGVEEMVLVITRAGSVKSLTYNPTLKYWTVREADVRTS